MTSIKLQQFNGIAPKIPAIYLAESAAQTASNVRLNRNSIMPMKDTVTQNVTLNSATRTIYPYNGGWLEYNQDVYIVPVPNVDDVLQRVVIADEDYPKIRSGNGSPYRLGIPAPASAPTAAPSSIPNPNDPADLALSEDIVYVVTYVDAWGYEGPPSDPSTPVSRIRDTDVTVTFNDTVPSGAYNLGNGAYRRLYRSNSGSSATALQYVKDVPIASGSTTDTVDNADLQELLPSDTWIGPPNDNLTLYPAGPMRQVITLPGGVMAGFSGNTICFSEPYQPHAWPLAYRASLPYDIVGISPLPAGCAVLTTGKPFLFLGSHPSTMSQVEIPGEPQSCVSRRSIVDMGGVTFYASPDGLCAIDPSGVQILTESIITAEQWASWYSSDTIKAFLHEGRYVANFDTGSDDSGFIFDPRGEMNAFTTHNEVFDCVYRDESNGTVYVKQGTGLYKWEADTAQDKTYTWRSKIFQTGKYASFTVCRLEKEVGSCTVNIYGDGTLVKTKDCTSIDLFRLPAGNKYKQWEIEVIGTAQIYYIVLAELMSEVV